MTIPMKKTVKKATEADIGKHVFVTDVQTHPSVEQVGKGAHRHLAAVIPDEYKPDEPFVTVKPGGFVSTWKHAYIIHEEPVPYTEGQQASGLKPGDWVKVTRKAAKGEGGWENTWTDEMDKYVGSIAKVGCVYTTMGIHLLGCGGKNFPYFVLEKVTTRPANEEDTGRKCLYCGSEFTIEGIFRSASDGKLTAALKSVSGSMCVAELADIQVFLDQPQVQAPQATRPHWLPDGWRQLGPDEVIQIDDKVQSLDYPNIPKSSDIQDLFVWTGPRDYHTLSVLSCQVGKKVSDSRYPKDIWIRKVE